MFSPQRHINLTNIHPRYSSSSALVDSTLYIFGGRGCPSGRQELSPRNYYDLYSVNLLTQQVNKLWEASQTPDNGDFQPGENMIYDSEKDCFYFFCTQLGGILMRIDTKTPHFEPMSLPIGMKFPGQYLYSNLYYSPKQKKLYLAIHQAEVSGKADIDIYELNFPPIPISSFKQPEVIETQSAGNNRLYVWLCIIGGLLIVGIGTLYYRKKRAILARNEGRKYQKANLAVEPNTLQRQEKPEIKIDMPISTAGHTFHNYDFSKECVCFFVGFRVIDKEGNDITSSFTPTLNSNSFSRS